MSTKAETEPPTTKARACLKAELNTALGAQDADGDGEMDEEQRKAAHAALDDALLKVAT